VPGSSPIVARRREQQPLRHPAERTAHQSIEMRLSSGFEAGDLESAASRCDHHSPFDASMRRYCRRPVLPDAVLRRHGRGVPSTRLVPDALMSCLKRRRELPTNFAFHFCSAPSRGFGSTDERPRIRPANRTAWGPDESPSAGCSAFKHRPPPTSPFSTFDALDSELSERMAPCSRRGHRADDDDGSPSRSPWWCLVISDRRNGNARDRARLAPIPVT